MKYICRVDDHGFGELLFPIKHDIVLHMKIESCIYSITLMVCYDLINVDAFALMLSMQTNILHAYGAQFCVPLYIWY
jgi:hypothetical protein